MMIQLTAQERDKFALWCEEEAEVLDGLCTQMVKVDMERLAKAKRAQVVYLLAVASILRSIEGFEISAEESQ